MSGMECEPSRSIFRALARASVRSARIGGRNFILKSVDAQSDAMDAMAPISAFCKERRGSHIAIMKFEKQSKEKNSEKLEGAFWVTIRERGFVHLHLIINCGCDKKGLGSVWPNPSHIGICGDERCR
jgi:hypothetical protein